MASSPHEDFGTLCRPEPKRQETGRYHRQALLLRAAAACWTTEAQTAHGLCQLGAGGSKTTGEKTSGRLSDPAEMVPGKLSHRPC
jgi:hypothetical protein